MNKWDKHWHCQNRFLFMAYMLLKLAWWLSHDKTSVYAILIYSYNSKTAASVFVMITQSALVKPALLVPPLKSNRRAHSHRLPKRMLASLLMGTTLHHKPPFDKIEFNVICKSNIYDCVCVRGGVTERGGGWLKCLNWELSAPLSPPFSPPCGVWTR